MKATILQKSVTTNVIAVSANEAIRLVLESPEAIDMEVTSIKCQKIPNPGAVELMARVSAESGIHILGYFDGLLDHLPNYIGQVSAWAVVAELEYTINYNMPKLGSEEKIETAAGPKTSVEEVPAFDPDAVDPNDRAALTEAQRTEGDT